MSEQMPERLLACPVHGSAHAVFAMRPAPDQRPGDTWTEYLRADLVREAKHDVLIEAKRRIVTSLREIRAYDILCRMQKELDRE